MMRGWVEWDGEGRLEDLVTEEGRRRLEVIEEIGAGTAASMPLLLADGLVEGWVAVAQGVWQFFRGGGE